MGLCISCYVVLLLHISFSGWSVHCQCYTPVSFQSSSNIGKNLSQNREQSRSCSEYSQDTIIVHNSPL